MDTISCEHGNLKRSCEICELKTTLAEKEAQLCRAREAFIEIVNNCGCAEDADFCMNCNRANDAIAALSSTSPCRHALIAEQVADTEGLHEFILAFTKNPRWAYEEFPAALQKFLKREGK